MNATEDVLSIFRHALAAVDPSILIHHHISRRDGTLIINGSPVPMEVDSRVFVIGAGKASALMAKATEEILGDIIETGFVITKHGHAQPLRKIILREAGHPVPDSDGVKAAKEMMKLLEGLRPGDIVLFLLSGGASALLADFPEGSELAEIQVLYEGLLRSGANIHEMNTIRKHLSYIKGGRLAEKIYPARSYSFILSDVIGDDPGTIGSGPMVPDTTTFRDAWEVLVKYSMDDKLPVSVSRHMREGMEGQIPDTPKPGAACFARAQHYIIGNNHIALKAAAARAEALGYRQHIVTHTLEGEARELGKALAEKALAYKGPVPACFLYGGESTVTIKGKGKGGRNQELALAAGITLVSRRNTAPKVTILSAGTDGTDGPTDAAGALVNSDRMNTAIDRQLDPVAYLDNNDSYAFFSEINALVKTGATHTNVMDIIVILISRP